MVGINMERGKIKELSKSIRLRLDDGTLIASASSLGIEHELPVLHLSLPELIDLNLVSDADFERTQRFLSIAELPELPVKNGSALKKQRNDSNLCPIQGEDWQSKCRDIIGKLKNHLKLQYTFFENSVDRNEVPDYYQIVTKPMWFNLILTNLNSGNYQSPAEFCEDVRLLWTNCQLYNKPGQLVHTAGEKGLKKFDELWLSSGLAGERSKRHNAGMPAPKYELQDFESIVKPNRPIKKPKQTNSGDTYPVNFQESDPGPIAPVNVVPSILPINPEGKLSHEQRNLIVSSLQHVLNASVPEQISELMSLLPPEAISVDESGDEELDLDAVSDPTFIKLYHWIQSLGQGEVGGGGVVDSGTSYSYPTPRDGEGANDDDEDYMSD